MAKLVLHREGGEMRDIPLDQDRITIGRRADHDVCLPYPAVSADHAEIITVMADSFLHDLGSTNGTLVNGERVSKHFLRDRDKIDIGRQQLVYLTNDAETVEPLPVEKPDAKPAVQETAKVATVTTRAAVAARPSETRVEPRDARFANVDELMTDLMEMNRDASAAVDMSPAVAVVRPREAARNGRAESTSAVVEILSGPNAGQIAPLHKPEFLFGKLGATVAAIRKEGTAYRLVPIDRRSMPLVNGEAIDAEGVVLAFGDTIDVAGVKLRFDRRG
jgi:predicted component of type VI protein secretion system